MDSREFIDAQFDRAVEIVQGLPKNGPIQTGYEEKLTILYKQATVGNVQSPRPSMWDMLSRAKWDAWAKHKDLDSYEAKWLYVDALLKVLRKYSDKTVAMDFVRELESYTGDPSNMVMSGMRFSLPLSSSSESSASDDHPLANLQPSQLPNHIRKPHADLTGSSPHPRIVESSSEEEEEEEETDDFPPMPSVYTPSQLNRPQSSMSSRRYRTPMAGSTLLSPPPASLSVPATQPHAPFETPSAFAEGPPSEHTSVYGTHPSSHLTRSSFTDLAHSRTPYAAPPHPQFTRQYALGTTPRPASAARPALERAVESVQAHVAALTERLEVLEGLAQRSTASLSTRRSVPSPLWGANDASGARAWDRDDMGMWSLVLGPLARIAVLVRQLAAFVAHSQHRSPALAVVRRLFLDISFVLCVLALAKVTWRRSGMRRREVLAALAGLWRAVIGHKRPRVLVDRAV
ncbi:ACBP-domain-containing protein [Amylocystis lapponica]|nr:ACBP-domain-containing protein [Amylocystis lapponica]